MLFSKMGEYSPPKMLSLKQIENQMTVNKMLHDGVIRDTQLSQKPSKGTLARIHAWGADQNLVG
eukprot:CAMPEP_0173392756 /NCGR_PEP_ID=MMETSP1356-20130122/21026_1 /TAXON_ID=77927 ORGANISM="Hemiselmis virescens, Strain PCC157" /NCGR_SAMPLE_ID=MMETSP1356 /ASSEMBLY_ACC=CAM_ASM_000847 /LENGTH=63 /DNA_ID=CAMNT_0014350645 /DNA_START=32 /DNA_END=223 /DNA_ORIENTATION=+